MPDTIHCPHCGGKVHLPTAPRKKKNPAPVKDHSAQARRRLLAFFFFIILAGFYYATQIAPGLAP